MGLDLDFGFVLTDALRLPRPFGEALRGRAVRDDGRGWPYISSWMGAFISKGAPNTGRLGDMDTRGVADADPYASSVTLTYTVMRF